MQPGSACLGFHCLVFGVSLPLLQMEGFTPEWVAVVLVGRWGWSEYLRMGMSRMLMAADDWSCCYYFRKVKDHLIPVAF